MESLVETGARFWRDALANGSRTTIPRWTVNPVAGIAEHETAVPADVEAAARRLTDETGLPLSSVLLAAHVKVLAALSGESAVTTGYRTARGDRALPCPVATDTGSWRELVLRIGRIERNLFTHRDFPIDDLLRELRIGDARYETPRDDGPQFSLFETEFDPTGEDDGLLGENTLLWLGVPRHDGRLTLRLRYRTDAFDADCAARIAGYHRTALTLLTTDPEAPHEQQSLLAEDELRFQLDGLAGPHRDLPDARVHELFEQQVAAHPDSIAAVHGDRQWTYRQLDARANQLARALLTRGLRSEGVVAVVTERDLNWLAAVLAIFKAGGAYLPIEPHFPAERIATTLSRAECRLVLTEPPSAGTLDQALDSIPEARRMFIDTAFAEGHADSALGIEVTADQLAYIYFTSGSTGEPKGAMCEHAGMLNHLFAKIDDLGIGEGQVVAQTAPQCFDISLWQLISGLLTGGRTLLVEQGVILDVQRFVDEIVRSRVCVLQVVPSYLEAVLSYLEQYPRELPDLRCVSVTGEAVKAELVQRWFASHPGITLVNAYGLTETSDDTNHEVMDRMPDRDRIPLGRAVNNVEIRVVDEHLSPVPLGAPGAIVFAGVCVGRGYVNDPERTRASFLADPQRPGGRLYQGGDHGRWLPDGKLEFLGRRDAQVKIRGFRIEIGEIENALLRVPGVRDGAVVVSERAGKQLIAFYSGEQHEADDVRERLGRSLPEYMVPAAVHWRERLPLTANGKIDRNGLTALAAELESTGQDHDTPSTPTERWLAAAWAEVLGVPPGRIGRRDHFFDRGGTSLSAVKLAIGLNRAVSLTDLTRHPVLTDLAELVDDRSEPRSGLVHALSEPGGTGALVCFPHAGGNAVNFRPMADALRDGGPAVYAVELPGHDLADQGAAGPDAAKSGVDGEHESFAPLSQVVEQVVAEITDRGLTGILLWGHSSGAAFAVETARRLRERGADLRHVFIGAQLLGDAADRRASIADLAGRSDAELAEALSGDSGYTELSELDGQRAERVGAAYRHDCVSAHRYFADALEHPQARLSTPLTVVTAADDPITARHPDHDWHLLAEHADAHELADGGHHFPRTRPAETAQTVLRVAGLLTSR